MENLAAHLQNSSAVFVEKISKVIYDEMASRGPFATFPCEQQQCMVSSLRYGT